MKDFHFGRGFCAPPPVYLVVCSFTRFEPSHEIGLHRIVFVKRSSLSADLASYAPKLHWLHPEIYDFNSELALVWSLFGFQSCQDIKPR